MRARREQEVLPVFGPSFTEDGSPRCSDWTRSHEPCARKATIAANRRHGGLCKQHAELRQAKRRGRRS